MLYSQERLPRQGIFDFLFLTQNLKKNDKILSSRIHSSLQTYLGSILTGVRFVSFLAPHFVKADRLPQEMVWWSFPPSHPWWRSSVKAHFSIFSGFSKTHWGRSLCGYTFSIMNELFIYVMVIHKKMKALAQNILRSVALKIQALLKHTSMLYGLQWLKITWHTLSCWNTDDEWETYVLQLCVLYWDRLWKTLYYLFNNYIDFSKVLRNPF